MYYVHVRLNPAERAGSVRRHAAVRHSLHVLADQVTHLRAEATNMKSFFAFRCLMCNVLHLERLVGVDNDLTLLLVSPRDHQHVVQAA